MRKTEIRKEKIETIIEKLNISGNVSKENLHDTITQLRANGLEWAEIAYALDIAGYRNSKCQAISVNLVMYYAKKQTYIKKDTKLLAAYLEKASRLHNFDVAQSYQLLYDTKKELRLSYKELLEIFGQFDFKTKLGCNFTIYNLSCTFAKIKRDERK